MTAHKNRMHTRIIEVASLYLSGCAISLIAYKYKCGDSTVRRDLFTRLQAIDSELSERVQKERHNRKELYRE